MIEDTQYDDFDALERIRKEEINQYYPISLLDAKQIAKLKLLNHQLTNLEIDIAKEIKAQIKYAKSRIEDKNSLINDFSCDLSIEFYLTNSKYYDEENDNMIMKINCSFHDENWDWGIDDKQCHNTLSSQTDKFKDDKHCYSFHGLYDHTSLEWNEILYIDTISFNITTTLEYDNDN